MNVHKVVWQEGMLLRPQHFQHNDRYYDSQMKTRTQLLGTYTYGFINLEIDLQFLNMGKLVISRAAGILPDGSLFELDGSSEPLALDVPPNTGATPIFMALPLVTGNHIEARRPEQSDVLTRHLRGGGVRLQRRRRQQQPDQLRPPGLPPAAGRAANRPGLRQAQGLRDARHLARRRHQPRPELRADLHSHPRLGVPAVVPQRGHQHAGAAGDTLAERIRSNGKVGGAEVGDFMMLQLINRTEMLLRHYLSLEQVHPEELYRTFLIMLGDLSTFSSDTKRPRLDAATSTATRARASAS
jgi:type VI secretion system protein ImpJ